MRMRLAALIILVLCPQVGFAQALADRLPADAIIYAGWKGTDAPGSAYADSHLHAVMAASQVDALLKTSIPQLIERIRQQNVLVAAKVQEILDIAGPVMHHPTAFYFGGVDAGGPPIPKIALLCEAGADADSMNEKITGLLNQAGGPAAMVHVKTVDKIVVVATFELPDHPQQPLSQDANFKTAMMQLTADPVGALYVDGVALNRLANQLIQQSGNLDIQGGWAKAAPALGLDGLQRIAITAGFEGRNWVTQALIDAPAPRHGLLQALDSQPLSDALIRRIPQSVTMAGAATLDLAALFSGIHGAVQEFAPQAAPQFDQGIGQVNQMLGINVQRDLLGALGPQWAYFIDPARGGDGIGGLTILNHPRDPARLEASITKVETFITAILHQQLPPPITLQIRKETVGGVNLHFIAAPFASPAWAIKDGTWYAGFFPQVVAAAAGRTDAKSLLDNPAYQLMQKRLGSPTAVNTIAFVDLPRTFPEAYSSCLMVSRMYLGLGDLFGLQSPAMVMPPLDKLLAEMEPAGAATWSDDKGFHLKAVEPFPGASALNNASGSIATDSLLVSILLPALNRARETANRIKCAANLRQISQGCLMYANDHNGAFPPDLGTVLKTGDVAGDAFVCPSSNSALPSIPRDQLVDWVNTNSDYTYIGAGLTVGKAQSDMVVIYENDNDHQGQGMNVAFGDGHVEFMTLDQAHHAIERSKAAHP